MGKCPRGLFDRIVNDALSDTLRSGHIRFIRRWATSIKKRLGLPAKLADYGDYVSTAVKRFSALSACTPCIDPMFDHSPRSANRGVILHNNSPKKWGELCAETKQIVMRNEDKDNLIFIKAWNEWGEGNYMEPDSKYGKAYIEEAGKVARD